MSQEIIIADRLIHPTCINIDTKDHEALDMDHRGYGGIVNSLCVKSLSFILLHELNHCVNDHFNDHNQSQKEKEREADVNAFIKMYDSAPNEEKTTVGFALLAIMITCLFLSPELKRTGSHRRIDERLLDI